MLLEFERYQSPKLTREWIAGRGRGMIASDAWSLEVELSIGSHDMSYLQSSLQKCRLSCDIVPAAQEDIAAGELLICERPMDLVRPGVARLNVRDRRSSHAVSQFIVISALELEISSALSGQRLGLRSKLGGPGCAGLLLPYLTLVT